MTRVLVLGASGMLGSMVVDLLSRNPEHDVLGTVRDATALHEPGRLTGFDAGGNVLAQMEAIFQAFPAELIINCIGLINRYCRDDDEAGVRSAVVINALFPHVLNESLAQLGTGARVIHATTDCVFSGRAGGYDEDAIHDPIDFYGKSKSLGEVVSPRWLNLRCSIVGPERKTRGSLMEWFLGQAPGSEVHGYAHHLWNGVTTLQFAQFCETVAGEQAFSALRTLHPTIHLCPNGSLSKYDLLVILNEVYERRVTVRSVRHPGPTVDRRLASLWVEMGDRPMRDAIVELRSYCDAVGFSAGERRNP